MPRSARAALGGVVYHVLNRGNGRMRIFRKPADYEAFLQLIADAKGRAAVEIFSFCLMPNHWHLVLRPRGDGDLAAYLSWLSNTHVKRYRAHYPDTSGHLYQGRYKSFPVEEDEYLLTLLRYVESNALRSEMVRQAQEWPWSSLGCDGKWSSLLLNAWPIDRPRNWATVVNLSLRESDLGQLRASFQRQRPLGSDAWTAEMALRMGLQHTLNPRGRPKKITTNAPAAGEKVDVTLLRSEEVEEESLSSPPAFD
jgi:REP-associated tyrosine transposase